VPTPPCAAERLTRQASREILRTKSEMRGKHKRLSKKEYLRLLRQKADEEAKDRSESEERQKRIRELWHLITSGKLVPGGDQSEHIPSDLKSEIETAVFAEWETVRKGEFEKALRQRDRQDTHERRSPNELVRSLVELVSLQKAEIAHMRRYHQLCEWAKAHAPHKLAALEDTQMEVVRAVLFPKPTPKQASEWRRMQSRGPRKEVGLIEYEFGGQADARAFPLPYEPTCLDGILMGYAVDMDYLEWLFEIGHHRFPRKLRSFRAGRKILYSAFAVVEIMDALLREEALERKPQARGGSKKKLWLSNPDVRKRVLMGIGWRAHARSRSKKILAMFMAVVCRRLPIEYLKEQLPEGFEEWLALAASWPDWGK
jgi:hypothetical protein